MGYRVEIFLDEVVYLGENIGDDFQFIFNVNGQTSTITRRITYGCANNFFDSIYISTFDQDTDINIHVTAIEVDPVYNDSGAGNTIFPLDYQRADWFVPIGPHHIHSEEHQFDFNVRGDPKGDKNRVAIIQLRFKAYIEDECKNEGEQLIRNGVEDPASEKVLGTFEVPALTPPGNIGQLVKETLEMVGDPGGIAGRVDDLLGVNSIKASKAFDVWEVSSINICDAVYKCRNGKLVFIKYQNCEQKITQKKIKSLQFPEEADLRDSIIQKLKNIAKAIN